MKLYSDGELAEILNQEIFHQISEAADSLGLECYVVGGYVRDIFLERPSNDIDVVVVGSGIKVAEELKRLVGKKAHLSVPVSGVRVPLYAVVLSEHSGLNLLLLCSLFFTCADRYEFSHFILLSGTLPSALQYFCHGMCALRA